MYKIDIHMNKNIKMYSYVVGVEIDYRTIDTDVHLYVRVAILICAKQQYSDVQY